MPFGFVYRHPGNEEETMDRNTKAPAGRLWSNWYLLLLPTYVAVLWVPFYNRVEPTILGFPFFYAYQMIWVLISAVLTAVVFFATGRK
jgi:hypothetical protein